MAAVSELLWNTNIAQYGRREVMRKQLYWEFEANNRKYKKKRDGRSNASIMHTSQHNAKALYLNWTDVKGKTKNTRGCYEINFNVLDCSVALKHGSSYRG